jgi:hypothetical protein
MSERVVPADVAIEWDPNTEVYVLVSGGSGPAVLALNPHYSADANKDVVLLVWKGPRFVSMGGPNDEALSSHRLYSKGLRGLRWVGIVEDSELIAMLERQNGVHERHNPARFASLVHYVLPLKGDVVEVVADSLTIERRPGTQLEAAAAALDR